MDGVRYVVLHGDEYQLASYLGTKVHAIDDTGFLGYLKELRNAAVDGCLLAHLKGTKDPFITKVSKVARKGVSQESLPYSCQVPLPHAVCEGEVFEQKHVDMLMDLNPLRCVALRLSGSALAHVRACAHMHAAVEEPKAKRRKHLKTGYRFIIKPATGRKPSGLT